MTDQQLERGIRLIRKVTIRDGQVTTTNRRNDELTIKILQNRIRNRHINFLSDVARHINDINPRYDAKFSHGPFDSDTCLTVAVNVVNIKTEHITIYWAPNEFNNQMWLGAIYDTADEQHGLLSFTTFITASAALIADQIIVEMQKI